MIKVELRPSWEFQKAGAKGPSPVLFDLLAKIQETGTLKSAAQSVHLSYRYAWEQFVHWEAFFGTPLIAMRRGQGTSLTPFGAELLSAQRRISARLQLQMDNCAAELEEALHETLQGQEPTLRIHASHGYTIERLREFLDTRDIAIDLRYVSNEAALSSLCRGRCDIAGFHAPIGALRAPYLAYYTRWLKPRGYRLIRLVTRTQGLIVARGNPKAVTELADLTRRDLRFINRETDSGTRILFDVCLQQQGINGQEISGYDEHEYTHPAVAAYVASGKADVGFGVQTAAREFGLDFIALAHEQYFFVVKAAFLASERMKRVMQAVESDQFKKVVSALPGYGLEGVGTIDDVADLVAPAPVKRTRARHA